MTGHLLGSNVVKDVIPFVYRPLNIKMVLHIFIVPDIVIIYRVPIKELHSFPKDPSFTSFCARWIGTYPVVPIIIVMKLKMCFGY